MTTEKQTDLNDPHATREAEKYDNPIPSREFILQTLEELQKPLRLFEVAKAVNVDEDDEERYEALSRRLKAMVRDGQLIRNRRGAFGLLKKMDLIKGRVLGHPDGFGFVVPDEGGKDLFLSEKEMHKILHGDRVIASVVGEDRRGRQEGIIVEVTEHCTAQLLGRLSLEDGMAWVRPDNNRIAQDVFIPQDGLMDAKEDQIVLVEILHQPSARSGPIGKVVEVVGDYMAPGMEIDSAIHAHGIPNSWSDALIAELDQIGDEVTEADLEGRKDLRNLQLVTIDGADTKDFDDAVFAKRRKNGWKLIVAIADVSHYVKPGTELDKEALKRGNSVYFPQRVVPMLPSKLSDGLCSLNPHVDRLCMVADMAIDESGKLERTQFYQAVMNSKARLTYTQVNEMVTDANSPLRSEYSEQIENVDTLYELFKVLQKAREERGALEFDTTETRIVFDDERKIKEIVPVVRNDAHKLIEECMLMANVATARFLKWHKMPIVYRVHESPMEDRLQNLRTFLADFGLTLNGGDTPTAQDFAEVAAQVEDKPYKHLVQTVMLRSMNQAVYHPENKGHFGLNYENYTHFTSPIRRYPDLLVHRAIRHVWSKQPISDFIYDDAKMVEMGQHCSDTERRADDATRDAETFLKCEFLSHRLGEEYEAVITAATNFGLFVEMDPLYVEGLVHITELGDDYFHYDNARHCLKGERTGKVYRLGDRIKVQVAQVNLDERKVDLRFIESLTESEDTGESEEVREDSAPAEGESQDDNGAKKKPRKKRYYRKKRSGGKSSKPKAKS
ncbi:ribonuclease R [Thiomicrorhabdus xiamenensis]|uniref:Ribonuclease R n=1 Tax=Thiomicrorhabdus xiamenensis TaxID=2739063 RepID=A0A7D4SZ56_9GAMM|nr:ribonuclease R [Thiomicrorhabdus xiamenensis]QKI89604.1 ribonuclease R [Thiomicrorhabdus xiamenensis]